MRMAVRPLKLMTFIVFPFRLCIESASRTFRFVVSPSLARIIGCQCISCPVDACAERTGNTHSSAVAAHASTGYEINWQPMILAKEGLTTKRKVLESLSIHRLNGKTLNQDRGLQISKLWLDLVTPAGESSAKKSHL